MGIEMMLEAPPLRRAGFRSGTSIDPGLRSVERPELDRG
jgi:hypothetical protein